MFSVKPNRHPPRPRRRDFSFRSLGGYVLATVLALVACYAPAAKADDYPSKPIRLVVPWPAGGSSDLAARAFAEKLSQQLKTPIVVENKGGASGRIGIRDGLSRPADGYTLILVNTSTNVALPLTDSSLDYDPVKSFQLLAPVAIVPSVVAVHPSVPAKTLDEFIAYAKQEPEKVAYASPGEGSTHHLNTELFSAITGVKLLHVPYKGGAQARTDLLAGRVSLYITDFGLLEDIKHGRLRALTTNAPKRVPFLPDLPTATELGLNGFDRVAWHGLAVPPGVPQPIVDKLVAAINVAAQDKDLQERLERFGLTAGGGDPEQFAKQIATDLRVYRETAQRLGIKFGQ